MHTITKIAIGVTAIAVFAVGIVAAEKLSAPPAAQQTQTTPPATAVEVEETEQPTQANPQPAHTATTEQPAQVNPQPAPKPPRRKIIIQAHGDSPELQLTHTGSNGKQYGPYNVTGQDKDGSGTMWSYETTMSVHPNVKTIQLRVYQYGRQTEFPMTGCALGSGGAYDWDMGEQTATCTLTLP